MTEAQRAWLEKHPGWEAQEKGAQGRSYIHVGVVDRDGNFTMASTTKGTNTFRLTEGKMLVGIPG